MHFDRLLTNARIATLAETGTPYGEIGHGAIGISGDKIAWVGPMDEIPGTADITEDLENRWVTPALIDCHTHLVFAGDRSDEYERKLAGESYEVIAREGGGIRKTMTATRKAGAAELAALALTRLDAYAAEGVGTIEIKSGYGLTVEAELAQLKAARGVGLASGMRIVPTLLAAHAVPPEYEGRSGDYIDEVCIPLVREIAKTGLAEAVDAYCEGIGFSPEETRRLFIAAKAADLPVKLHADQLSDTGGAQLVAEFGGLSADHIEYTNEAGIAAMAKAGTVGVLLPGAFYALRETQRPPVEAMRAAGVKMAVATDANPGTSPMVSLLMAANMACTLFHLTVEEAFAGITREAARALGKLDEIGTLEPGKMADLAIWDIERPAELVQWMGKRPLHGRILGGEWL
ncbi:imidazolonepropionase [Maricaulis parjimensis]|uniref:imidazolonepropionase n=1 Tax=Maricaulis parjimensis TaxID=144023 RepID=UPI00193A6E50|nr:imidazolonepropionase [Maricaulis parjimensis]